MKYFDERDLERIKLKNHPKPNLYGRNLMIVNGYKPLESAPELLDEIRVRIRRDPA